MTRLSWCRIQRWRRIAAAGVLASVSLACTSAPGIPSASTAPPASASPVVTPSLNPTPALGGSGHVVLRAPLGRSLLVHGAYPHHPSPCKHPEQPRLLARYPGALDVRRADDGTLSLTLTLPFEAYLRGIAEVPPTWPTAALQAQAIAARSYALASTGWSGQQGETLATPICATTSCQVYGGMPVGSTPGIDRWYAAVAQTAGQVLLYQGRPADTVYFSTSNGQTYGNEVVFGSAPLPYLRPVAEHDDGASPTSHWEVRIGFHDLATFLHRGHLWPATARIAAVSGDGDTVTVTDGSGATHAIDGSDFRDAVNEWAPCLRPGRYPPSPLPVTIPSRWMDATSSAGAAMVTGRGWGHGVGMVQWGAYGKALRGWSASQILSYYYGGLTPQRYPEPGLIHVQVASGLRSVWIHASGSGATLNGKPLRPGAVVIVGGSTLAVGGSALASGG